MLQGVAFATDRARHRRKTSLPARAWVGVKIDKRELRTHQFTQHPPEICAERMTLTTTCGHICEIVLRKPSSGDEKIACSGRNRLTAQYSYFIQALIEQKVIAFTDGR